MSTPSTSAEPLSTDRRGRRHRRKALSRMPITPTEKIWMDGELVDWADATVHVLTHTMHYGSGVFEGIRAYPTSRGVAVFRLGDHIRRLFASAKIFMIDIPFTVDEIVEAAPRRSCGSTGSTTAATSARSSTSATARWASTRCRARSTCPSPAWPWGTYLGDEGVANGVSCKVSSWQRHDPNAVPTAAKGTGMYVNSSLAKVEALKAGYDEAILLAPNGNVSECTGENIFIVRDGVLITPPTSDAGALDGITQDSVETIAARPRLRGRATSRSSAPTSTWPTRPSSPGRRPRSCRSAPSTTARSAPGKPGTDHQGDPADLLRHRAGRGRPVQGLARPCRLTPATAHSHGGARHTHAHGHTRPRPRLRRARAARGGRHLRHHPARREPAGGAVAHRRRQAAGGRAARPSRGHLHRGRMARRQPQGRRVLRPGPAGADARPRPRWSPSARPGGPA